MTQHTQHLLKITLYLLNMTHTSTGDLTWGSWYSRSTPMRKCFAVSASLHRSLVLAIITGSEVWAGWVRACNRIYPTLDNPTLIHPTWRNESGHTHLIRLNVSKQAMTRTVSSETCPHADCHWSRMGWTGAGSYLIQEKKPYFICQRRFKKNKPF